MTRPLSNPSDEEDAPVSLDRNLAACSTCDDRLSSVCVGGYSSDTEDCSFSNTRRLSSASSNNDIKLLPEAVSYPDFNALRSDDDNSSSVLPESAGNNFSFAGCGFMGVYHLGVCSCLKEYAISFVAGRPMSGASAGALAACALMCDCDLGQCANFVLSLVNKASVRTLGPFHPSFSITSLLKRGLDSMLPPDAHLICSGRLFVSVTDVLTFKNRILSDFPTRDYLIQALLCSAHIPGFSGLTFPELNGVRLMDGCFSSNLPRLNSHSILVSPFAGTADISPEDDTWFMMPSPSSLEMDFTLANWRRILRVLWPPNGDVLAQICQRGFDDCIAYLHRSGVMQPSPMDVEDNDIQSEMDEFAIQMRLAKNLQASLPPPVIEALERYKHKTLLRRLYDSNMIRILRILIQPATLPIDIVYLLCTKLLRYLPSLPEHAQNLMGETRAHLKSFTTRVSWLRRNYTFAGRSAVDRTIDEEQDVESGGGVKKLHSFNLDYRELLSSELDFRLGEEEAHDNPVHLMEVVAEQDEDIISFYLEDDYDEMELVGTPTKDSVDNDNELSNSTIKHQRPPYDTLL